MAQTKQAEKRIRQNNRKRLNNSSMRSRMRTLIKNVRAQIERKEYEDAQKAYTGLAPILDSYANKGLIHQNKAARLKARLTKQLKSIHAAA